MHRNWFMFPPHSSWLESIVNLIAFKTKHGRSYDEIIQTVREYSPESGWDEDTKQFVKLAAKIAKRDADGF